MSTQNLSARTAQSAWSSKTELLDAVMHCLTSDPSHSDEQRAHLLGEMARMYDYGCEPTTPVREVLRRIGDRWSSLLMVLLSSGTLRYSQLKKLVNFTCQLSDEVEISQRMLTLRLRALERDGLVLRTVLPTVPPRVDYTLTATGKSLSSCILAILRWSEEHDEEIRRSQAEFDSRDEPMPDDLV